MRVFLNKIILLTLIMLFAMTASADEASRQAFNGIWILNVEQSDDTDKQVEKAIKAAGGKVRRVKKKGKYKYKGGPKNHELYDHISYDEAFNFFYEEPRVWIGYLDDYSREFYSDGRGRSVSASAGEVKDYSFASWDNNVLYVEARPRDGGVTQESYSLINGGTQMKVELEVRPLNFGAPIKITRIFDRKKPN